MSKRKWLVMLILLLLVLAFVLYWQLPSRWHRAYSRIKLGTTLKDVTTAIGLPPGYYEGEFPRPPSMGRWIRTPPLQQAGVDFERLPDNRHNLETWIGRDYVIWVLFDDQGTAIGSYLLELYPDELRGPSLTQWLRDLFR